MAGTVAGRERERALLASAVHEAVSGRGSVVHIVGEPGIGKTTLCEAAVEIARTAGAESTWGRAIEGAPPFWLWRRAVAQWPTDGGETDRFELFEAVAADLAERSLRSGGLLVVLDDLHWADAASLRLLEHVAAGVRDSPLLLVVTSRRAEAGAGTTLGEISPALARHGTVIELIGLGVDDIAEVARAATGTPIDAAAVTAIAELTDGNPFFVQQVAHLVAQRGGGAMGRFDVPAGVDAVVRQRVGALGAEAGEVLSAAAVLGRAFDLDELAAVVGPEIDGPKAVEVALEAGLLAVDAARADRVRFVHAIVRDALHEELPLRRRAELHGRALAHLASVGVTAPSILAMHAAEAVPVLGREPAIDHGLNAAQAALEATAFEDAVRMVDLTLALDPGDGARARLLTVAGHAWFNLDDHLRSKASFLEAADRVEVLGDLVATARVLLAVGTGRLVGRDYADVGPRIRRVLEGLGEDEPGLRADLLSRLADFVVPVAERRALLTDAVDLARSVGDDESLGLALGRTLLHGVSWMSMPERLDAVEELRAVARRVGSPRLRLDGEYIASRVLLEAGDFDAASRTANALADDPLVRSGSFQLRAAPIIDTTIAVARGEFDRAERLFESMQTELARRDSGAAAVLTGLMGWLRREAGKGAELVPAMQAIRTLQDFADNLAVIDAMLALLLADTGDLAAARLAIDATLTHDLETIARDWAGIGICGCGALAEAMWLTDHAPPDAVARLVPLLEPMADRNLVLGMLPMAVTGWGTYHLGLCAALDSRFDEAATLLRESVDRHRSMRARPLLGRSLLALAEAEVGRLDGASALAAAREAAEVLGSGPLPVLAERAERLLSALGGKSGATTPDAEPGTTTFVFTDIVGSTARAATGGDAAWLAVLDTHASVVRALAARHGGRVVKGLGDGFMLAFPTAGAGVRFALAARDSTAGSDLAITAGVHTGEAQQIDGDYLGHHVNVAARIAAAAHPDEVVVSDVVARVIEADTDLRLADPRTVELKGLGPERVHPAAHAT